MSQFFECQKPGKKVSSGNVTPILPPLPPTCDDRPLRGARQIAGEGGVGGYTTKIRSLRSLFPLFDCSLRSLIPRIDCSLRSLVPLLDQIWLLAALTDSFHFFLLCLGYSLFPRGMCKYTFNNSINLILLK